MKNLGFVVLLVSGSPAHAIFGCVEPQFRASFQVDEKQRTAVAEFYGSGALNYTCEKIDRTAADGTHFVWLCKSKTKAHQFEVAEIVATNGRLWSFEGYLDHKRENEESVAALTCLQ